MNGRSARSDGVHARGRRVGHATLRPGFVGGLQAETIAARDCLQSSWPAGLRRAPSILPSTTTSTAPPRAAA